MKKFTMFKMGRYKRRKQGVKRKGFYIYYGSIEGNRYKLYSKKEMSIVTDGYGLTSGPYEGKGCSFKYIKLPADLIFGNKVEGETNYNNIKVKGPFCMVIHSDDGFKEYIKKKYDITY